ncbi:MAG: histidine phosphatase family protein [Gammaproteobacteria bacterium]|nr:histidine phosphatase family protein [Gammaproteobacteria bacterium]
MAKIRMVRHGKAAAGFDGHLDPGLDDLGRSQAEAVAQLLQPVGPLPVFSSPLARAQETAAPLAQLWQEQPVIEPRVAEIPSPIADLAARSTWLRGVMQERWSNLNDDLKSWRRDMIECITGFEGDCVVFCHFIAINVIVGAATGADEMISFRPDNGSVTILTTTADTIELVELGREADTRVN